MKKTRYEELCQQRLKIIDRLQRDRNTLLKAARDVIERPEVHGKSLLTSKPCPRKWENERSRPKMLCDCGVFPDLQCAIAQVENRKEAGERWLDGGHPGYIEQAKKLARKALALCEEGLTIEAWRRANATVLRRRARYPQHGNLYHVLASHGKDAWELGILLRTTGGRDFYIATSTPDRSVPAIWRVFPSRRAHRHAAYLGIQG